MEVTSSVVMATHQSVLIIIVEGPCPLPPMQYYAYREHAKWASGGME
jgi:hypothetical protein